MHPAPPDRDEPIALLQWLRGLAALAVIACHFLSRLRLRGVLDPDLIGFVDYLGAVGVATFFAISGFIMVHTTRGAFGRPGGGARFMARRFLRIVPLYYATTVLIVLFKVATAGADPAAALPSPREVVLSALFVPYLNEQGIIQPIYGLGWSLNFEMFFYALFAVAMRFRLGLVGLVGVLLALAAWGTRLDFPAPSAGPVEVLAYFYTRPVLMFFVIGIGTGLLRAGTGFRLAVGPGLAGLACLALVGCAAAAQILVPARTERLEMSALSYLAIALALGAAAFARRARPADGRAAARLTAAFRRLGDVSYGLYLTHSFVLGGVAFAAARTGLTGPVPVLAFTLVAFAACYAVAEAAWSGIERPAARWLRPRSAGPGRAGPGRAGRFLGLPLRGPSLRGPLAADRRD